MPSLRIGSGSVFAPHAGAVIAQPSRSTPQRAPVGRSPARCQLSTDSPGDLSRFEFPMGTGDKHEPPSPLLWCGLDVVEFRPFRGLQLGSNSQPSRSPVAPVVVNSSD